MPPSSPETLGPDRIATNRRRGVALAALPALVAFVVAFLVAGLVVSPLVGVVAGAVAALAAALVAWWGGAAIVFRLSGARVAGLDEQPRVHNLIDGLCAASGIPKPELRVVEDDVPNSLAVGVHPRRATVVVTTGLVSTMSRIELEGVLAHELCHIKSHDIVPGTVAVTSLGPLALVVPPAGQLVGRGAGSSREEMADLAGVALTRYPPGLISALEKIEAAGGPSGRTHAARDRLTEHLWILTGGRPLGERLQALREL